jgi:pyruvate dehydrogenase E1 component alpha subunit
MAAWDSRCPVASFRHHLLAESWVSEETLAEMERTIDAEIEEAFLFARESPLPRREDLCRYLYRE